jgi:2-furoate---CoA ligase
MIITGGENVSPVEIESCLSLHPAVAEVAVVGLRTSAGARSSPLSSSGAAASIRRTSISSAANRGSPILRPRRYVFVEEIPKSPVGKLLRRKLVAGEYQPEAGGNDGAGIP